MKVEILYFDGCPSYGTAEKILKGVFADEGIEAQVELVAVNTDEESRRLRFLDVSRSEWTNATSFSP